MNIKCKICNKELEDISYLWADTYCQDCWEDFCNDEYLKELEKLPYWCFEKYK